VDRHGLSALAMTRVVVAFCLSLRGGQQYETAIHRVSGDADGFVSSITASQWIATGFALAMTRWWVKGTVRAYVSLFTLQSSLFFH